MTVPEARPVTGTRIRWEPTEHGGWTGHVGTIDGFVFQVWKPAPLGDKPWRLESGLPGFFGFHVDSDDPEALKAEAEHHLAVFVTSLGAAFPEPGTAQVAIEEEKRPAPYFDEHDLAVIAAFDDDEAGEPLEIKYAAGRRVRYAHPGAGYPGEAEHAAASLVLGEVYTIGWADIGQSRTNLNLYRGKESVGSFNSVFFDLADDEPEAKTATAGEE